MEKQMVVEQQVQQSHGEKMKRTKANAKRGEKGHK